MSKNTTTIHLGMHIINIMMALISLFPSTFLINADIKESQIEPVIYNWSKFDLQTLMWIPKQSGVIPECKFTAECGPKLKQKSGK